MRYDEAVVNMFKTIEKRKFDILSKRWSFPLHNANEISNILFDSGYTVRFSP